MSDDDREVLQRFLDNLFRETKTVSRLDVILRAQTLDLDEDLAPLFDNLPSGGKYNSHASGWPVAATCPYRSKVSGLASRTPGMTSVTRRPTTFS